ncbi:MAG: chemotaxis protein CheA [Acidithiobacillus sp.]|uniref:chemotaxis protein CheA n=1 Tax=Acidithiobacillus sp. TaxID=1872118 RepID=UPI003CFEC6EF
MDREILEDYLPEARELLEQAQEMALRLEADPQDDNILASLFRAFHTLKGGAGFLEATALVDWAHHLEDLLDRLREHTVAVTPAVIDGILGGIDVIADMLNTLALGEEPSPGPEELARTLSQLAAATEQKKTEQAAAASDTPSQGVTTTASDEISTADFAAALGRLKSAAPSAKPQTTDEISQEEFEAYLDSLYGGGAPGLIEATSPSTPTPQPSPAPSSTIESAAQSPSRNGSPPTQGSTVHATPAGNELADSTLRVDAQRLDAVMNQVGELVLLRNRLTSAAAKILDSDEDLARIAREMDLTVNDLQNTVMRLRMQPCKRLFQQLPRVVRDASRQLGKEVRLDIVGEEVEIDKTVVDALSAPLTHLLRNSLDHGIEYPAEREALGKPREARIRVAAIHLGDKVRIEVSDDGHGIDAQKVAAKAVEKGLITAEQATRLSEQDAIELIFRPGFSTNDRVTDISGRGVGMDVVRETTRALRGRLDLSTRSGQGTTVALEFPLTLAVLPVLYLRLRREIYALPISSINGLLDIDPRRQHRLGGQSVYRVDSDNVVPLVDLGHILHQRPLRLGAEVSEGVLTDRGLLLVSEVLGTEDSVVKALDFLSEPNWYQGATISGQGQVVLILDPASIVQKALEGVSVPRSAEVAT